MTEDLSDNLTSVEVEEEVSRHTDTKHAIDKEHAEAVAMGKALIDRMQLSPLYDEEGAPNRPPHLLEETLLNLEETKVAWDRVWNDRDERLHHWLKRGDYEQQVSEVIIYTNCLYRLYLTC